MAALSDCVEINDHGWLWPKADRIAWRIIKDELAEIPEILTYCKSRRVCIQAGGNGGLWVDALAGEFERVVTFEPDPVNFRCLVHNVDRPNVTFMQAGLGHAGSTMGIVQAEANSGGHQINPDDGTGVQILAIDQLGLSGVDLIQLDIEGFELFALHGARQTIEANRPVVVVELRGHSAAYGYTDNHVRGWFASHSYRLAKRTCFDEIYVPLNGKETDD